MPSSTKPMSDPWWTNSVMPYGATKPQWVNWLCVQTHGYPNSMLAGAMGHIATCKRDATPLLTHWSYVSFALSHRCTCRCNDNELPNYELGHHFTRKCSNTRRYQAISIISHHPELIKNVDMTFLQIFVSHLLFWSVIAYSITIFNMADEIS